MILTANELCSDVGAGIRKTTIFLILLSLNQSFERLFKNSICLFPPQTKHDLLQARSAAQIFAGGGEHHFGEAVDRIAKNAGGNGRKREAFQLVLISQLERAERGLTQLAVFVAFAHLRADGVNDVLGFESAAGGNDRSAHRSAANLVALVLNRLAALAAD